MDKQCNICNQFKPISEYYKQNEKPIYCCKICHRLKSKQYRENNKGKSYEYIKTWTSNNRERVRKSKTKWRLKNQDYHKEYRDNFYKENPNYNKDYYWKNVEKRREASREYRKKNPKHNQEYQKKRFKTDTSFRIARNLRQRIRKVLKVQGKKKENKLNRLLGCSAIFLKSYLESKFLPTMTWENYGIYWHIDHIVPCRVFDLTKDYEQRTCFHYTNLQPLFAVTQTINGVEYIGNINKN